MPAPEVQNPIAPLTPRSPVLLQTVTFSCAEPQANQHPLGGDGADETNGDSFRVEVAGQSGGQTAREPGTRCDGGGSKRTRRH